jgi:hypothetical protein
LSGRACKAATALIAKHGLIFPVGYGADAGKVVVSVYSSGAIGRLVPGDVAGLVRCVREHTPASA